MITFRTSTHVNEDRRVELTLPPDTPVGEAELTVTIAPQKSADSQPGSLRRQFGSVHSGNARSADSDRIEEDLARDYQDSHEEAT